MKKRGVAFLNSPGHYGEGVISWSVNSSEWGASFISIADCSRKVSLDIECFKAENTEDKTKYQRDFSNSLYKVNALIAELQACEKALLAEGKKLGYVS